MENIWLRKSEMYFTACLKMHYFNTFIKPVTVFFVLNPFAVLLQITDGSSCFPFL